MTTDFGIGTIEAVSGVTYGLAGELLTMNGGTPQTWTYNNRLQMTGYNGTTYAYDSTNNDGKLTSMTTPSGQTVTYQYDELARLTSATSNQGWSQTFKMDGFGNLYKKTGTGLAAGWAFDYSSSLNSARNQIGTGYDLNGNSAAGTYDAENRVASYNILGSTYQMEYAADNKRVYRKKVSGAATQEMFYFYLGNRRISTCNLTAGTCNDEVYFGGRKLELTDRLGSAAGTRLAPYGEELTSPPSGDDKTKFATYYRDQGGLDYADQRFYSQGTGRFLSADPFMTGTAQTDPTNWNRYSYAGSDPNNNVDPAGMSFCPAQFGGEVCGYLDGLPFDDPGAQCVYQATFVGVSGVPGLQQTNPCLSVPTPLLIAAAQSAEKSHENDCDFEMHTTPIAALGGIVGLFASHQYLLVHGANGTKYTIEGIYGSGGKLASFVDPTGHGLINNDPARDRIFGGHWTLPCDQADDITSTARTFKATAKYDALGPNSNSFMHWLVVKTGNLLIYPVPPSGAIGWWDSIPGN